ncbi:hypothetical protein BJ878DRAFT_575921 [Calycina marina]|uniref:Uncharacterized protein n=1 Tax=Calycina marina TaxID=1763456 RepID=A0A9P7Z3H7_9HELO|nr:hypothetical protein BJ878DRAFT_575921 [Calycina marina]
MAVQKVLYFNRSRLLFASSLYQRMKQGTRSQGHTEKMATPQAHNVMAGITAGRGCGMRDWKINSGGKGKWNEDRGDSGKPTRAQKTNKEKREKQKRRKKSNAQKRRNTRQDRSWARKDQFLCWLCGGPHRSSCWLRYSNNHAGRGNSRSDEFNPEAAVYVPDHLSNTARQAQAGKGTPPVTTGQGNGSAYVPQLEILDANANSTFVRSPGVSRERLYEAALAVTGQHDHPCSVGQSTHQFMRPVTTIDADANIDVSDFQEQIGRLHQMIGIEAHRACDACRQRQGPYLECVWGGNAEWQVCANCFSRGLRTCNLSLRE